MLRDQHRWLLRTVVAFAAMGGLPLIPSTVQADNGGVGFWLPGSMGSLSAVPG